MVPPVPLMSLCNNKHERKVTVSDRAILGGSLDGLMGAGGLRVYFSASRVPCHQRHLALTLDVY